MSWAGIDDELRGIRDAARNLNGDPDAFADYVYDRMTDFTGADHPATCKRLLAEAIRTRNVEDYEEFS